MTARAAKKPSHEELQERAAKIELLVFDVDGVLTDGGLWYGPDGEMFKRFDVKDGHGLVMARLTGLRAGILTARKSKIVEVRAKELGLDPVYQGQRDKKAGLEKLLAEVGISPDRVAYMGDDTNDLGPLSMVGLPACPADAAADARAHALFVSTRPGGHGAARELCELVLKATGRWEKALSMMHGPPTPG